MTEIQVDELPYLQNLTAENVLDTGWTGILRVFYA